MNGTYNLCIIFFEAPKVEENLIFRTGKMHVAFSVGRALKFVVFRPICVNSIICTHTTISKFNKYWIIAVDFMLRPKLFRSFEIFYNRRFNLCGFRRYSY